MANGKVLIVGAGRSGQALARLLRAEGREALLADEKLASRDLPADLQETPLLGGPFQSAWLAGIERVVLSPGVPGDGAAARAAAAARIPVSGEIEEAFARARRPIVAVTGTNGKSTTTTLIGMLLESQGYAAPAGGNLGRPFSQLLLEEPGADYYVLEISSFQCETFERFHPRCAGLLNLTPDHLDRYGDVERYYAAKLRLFERMEARDWIYAPDDAEIAARLAPYPPARLLFSLAGEVEQGAFLRRGSLWGRFGGQEFEILPAAELGLVGRHNLANALAAVAAVLPFGVEARNMAGVLRSFCGLPHRMEDLGPLEGLRCFNDSKATNVEAALASLSGMAGSILLIAGGRDKGGDFGMLAAGLPQVRRVYGIGEAGAAIVRAFGERGRDVGDLAAAVRAAREEGREGELLVLSPACASYDQYRNFEERGEHLRRLVSEARS